MKKFWLLIAILMLAGLVYFVWKRNQDSGLDGTEQTDLNWGPSDVKNFVLATSELENLNADKALELYAQLKDADREPAVLQDQAIALLVKVKAIDGALASQERTNDQKAELRSQLPELFQEIAEILAVQTELEPTNPDITKLSMLTEIQRIDYLPDALQSTMRKDLFSKGLEFMQKDSSDAVVAHLMSNLAAQLVTRYPDVNTQLLPLLQKSVAANPRNTFLLNDLILLKLELKDKSVSQDLTQALELFAPNAWQINALAGGGDMFQLMREAIASAESEPDKFETTAYGFVNTFKSSPIFQADSKRTYSDTLISMALQIVRLEPAYVQFEGQVKSSDKQIELTSLPEGSISWSIQAMESGDIPQDIALVQYDDWNIDMQPETVLNSGDEIVIGSLDIAANKWSALQSLAGISPVQTLKILDLYEVAASKRSQILDKPEGDLRHSTVRDLVLGTSAGIQVVAVQPDATQLIPQLSLVDPAVSNLPTTGNVTHLDGLDFEGDGDLDLACVIDGKISMFVNRGGRNFLDASAACVLPSADRNVTAIAAYDYDRDIDCDILVSFADGVGVLENILHGQFVFRELTGKWEVLAGATELLSTELDGNVSWDWIAQTDTGLQILLTRTVPSQVPVAIASTSIPCSGIKDFGVRDLNNDIAQDIAVVSRSGVHVLWLTDRGTLDFSSKTTISTESQYQNIDLMFDPSSASNRLLVSSASTISLARPASPPDNSFLAIRIKGISDNGGGNNNEYAIGSTLELFSEGVYQAQQIKQPLTYFGVGKSTDPYSLRIIFPNGLTQTVVEPESNRMIETKQEVKGSCPFLYGWDGERWQLITDCLWNAPLGLQIAPGVTLPARRWEYLSLPRKFMQMRDGGYEIRLTEELWETAYFDQVELLVVDHPAGETLLTNEKVGPAEVATPIYWTFADVLHAPVIQDQHQHDWTDKLRHQDGEVALPFDAYICQGLVTPHYLDVAIPEGVSRDNLQLVGNGWLCPTDTSINMALDQHTDLEGPRPPSLWVVDADGGERELMDFMGFPGGKTKTIVVDLSGKLLPGDQFIRVKTSAELYWDQIFLTQALSSEISAASKLELESADLHYRGFSRLMERRRDQPYWYDYQQVSQDPKWAPMSGRFTRYGDCRAILSQDDDRIVVMGSGDEIILRFGAGSAVQEGYERDFILHNIGWDKDADLNTITGQSSEPLPFHSMKTYPPVGDDWEKLREVELLNAETLTRRQSQEKFWRVQSDSL